MVIFCLLNNCMTCLLPGYIKEGSGSLLIIILMFIAIMVIFLVVFLLIYHFKCGGLPCCKKTKRVSSVSSEISIQENIFANGQGHDRNARTSFVSRPPINSKSFWLHRGPVVEANMIEPLPKVEPLYAMKPTRKGSSMSRRSSAGSLFNFNLKF